MSIDNTLAADSAGGGISRRKVIKAAAWSAPVIALAVATPMASASVTPPAPAPGGGLSYFDGGTSINTYVTQQPQYVRVNQGASIGLTVETADGDIAPSGTFTAGTATVVVAWGAGGTVTSPASYRLQETNLNGWVRVGAAPADGTSGTVTYQYLGGVVNGDENRVPLPVVRLYPTTSSTLTPTYVTTSLQSDYVSAGGSFRQVP